MSRGSSWGEARLRTLSLSVCLSLSRAREECDQGLWKDRLALCPTARATGIQGITPGVRDVERESCDVGAWMDGDGPTGTCSCETCHHGWKKGTRGFSSVLFLYRYASHHHQPHASHQSLQSANTRIGCLSLRIFKKQRCL